MRLVTTALLAGLTLAGSASLGAQQCDPHRATLFAGQHTDAGFIQVTNSPAELVVQVKAREPWHLQALHVYAGTSPTPLNGGGNPSPGQFPYKVDFSPPKHKHIMFIPLSDLQAQCGDDVYIAVHAELVQLDAHGNVIQQETGWAFGSKPFPGSSWGWEECYTICCDGCDLSPGALWLEVDQLYRGVSSDMRVTHALPGELVIFLCAEGLIRCGAGPACHLNGIVLDILPPNIQSFGSAVADANGLATLTVTPGPGVPLRAFSFQAVVQRTVMDAKSNPVYQDILP